MSINLTDEKRRTHRLIRLLIIGPLTLSTPAHADNELCAAAFSVAAPLSSSDDQASTPYHNPAIDALPASRKGYHQKIRRSWNEHSQLAAKLRTMSRAEWYQAIYKRREEDLSDYAQSRYNGIAGLHTLNRLRELCGGCESLIADPGLVFHLDEFENLLKRSTRSFDSAIAARNAFSKSLGTKTVYRALSYPDLRNAKDMAGFAMRSRLDGGGIESNYIRLGLRVEQDSYLWGPLNRALSDDMTARLETRSSRNSDTLMSVTTSKDIAISIAREYAGDNRTIAVYELALPVLDVFAFDEILAKHPWPKKKFKVQTGERFAIYRYGDPDVESFISFFIEPHEIRSVDCVDVDRAPVYVPSLTFEPTGEVEGHSSKFDREKESPSEVRMMNLSQDPTVTSTQTTYGGTRAISLNIFDDLETNVVKSDVNGSDLNRIAADLEKNYGASIVVIPADKQKSVGFTGAWNAKENVLILPESEIPLHLKAHEARHLFLSHPAKRGRLTVYAGSAGESLEELFTYPLSIRIATGGERRKVLKSYKDRILNPQPPIAR